MNSANALTALAAGMLLLITSCATPPAQPETAPSDRETLSAAALASSHGKISFAQHVKPVLQSKCVVCHNTKDQPWFSMQTREAVFARGGYGLRVVPGKPEESSLIFKGTMNHAGTMPPVGDRLTPDEKRILTAWVAQGAEWPVGQAGAIPLANPSR
jgi:uncharacterized membrane protein